METGIRRQEKEIVRVGGSVRKVEKLLRSFFHADTDGRSDRNDYLCGKDCYPMEKIIAPSMLSADFGHLERDVRMLNESHAQWFHVDVMDGVFVPNISFGFPVLQAIRRSTQKVVDTHLMIVEPERYAARFAKAGSDYVTFHIEATRQVQECIDLIHGAGAKAGISVKPATSVEELRPWLPQLDLVLVMSVEPGFGGQSFMEESLEKIARLRKLIEETGSKALIEVDGGLSSKNAGKVFAAGAEVIVAGSAVFLAPDPAAEIDAILKA